jgi:hypothetical protein
MTAGIQGRTEPMMRMDEMWRRSHLAVEMAGVDERRKLI